MERHKIQINYRFRMLRNGNVETRTSNRVPCAVTKHIYVVCGFFSHRFHNVKCVHKWNGSCFDEWIQKTTLATETNIIFSFHFETIQIVLFFVDQINRERERERKIVKEAKITCHKRNKRLKNDFIARNEESTWNYIPIVKCGAGHKKRTV